MIDIDMPELSSGREVASLIYSRCQDMHLHKNMQLQQLATNIEHSNVSPIDCALTELVGMHAGRHWFRALLRNAALLLKSTPSPWHQYLSFSYNLMITGRKIKVVGKGIPNVWLEQANRDKIVGNYQREIARRYKREREIARRYIDNWPVCISCATKGQHPHT